VSKRNTVDVILRIDAKNLDRLVREGDPVSMVWLEETSPGVYEFCSRRPDDMAPQEWKEGWVNDGSAPEPPRIHPPSG
jgi:hypothetical protein